VNLQELLHKSVSLIRIDAEAAGVAVFEKFPDSTLPVVRADADKLTQVFLNLLLNAIQSMENGGKLTVSAGKKEEIVEITVMDTGCGIGTENIDRVLDPYFTTKPEGTGLGLAMSAKIVEEHGGSIQILSEDGKGCSVKVRIPC
jgi:two-component system sensor histidine kinase HydH